MAKNVTTLAEPSKNGTTEKEQQPKPDGLTFEYEGKEVFVPVKKIINGGDFQRVSELVRRQIKTVTDGKPDTTLAEEAQAIDDAELKAAFMKEHADEVRKLMLDVSRWADRVMEPNRLTNLEYDYRYCLAALDFSDFRVKDGTITLELQKAIQEQIALLDSKPKDPKKDAPASNIYACELLMTWNLEEVRRIGSDFRKRVGV